MFGDARVIAVVPARGGSKAIPKKNLALLNGWPLVTWPVRSGFDAELVDRVIVSTDDNEIAEVSRVEGAEVYARPAELAGDDAIVIDTVRDLWETLRDEGETDVVMVLLEATAPIRPDGLVDECVRLLVDGGYDSIATFEPARLNPERAWRLEGDAMTPFIDGAVPWKPRQHLSPAYQLNGAVYAFYPSRLPKGTVSLLFGNYGAKIVEIENFVDIDSIHDLRVANAILRIADE